MRGYKVLRLLAILIGFASSAQAAKLGDFSSANNKPKPIIQSIPKASHFALNIQNSKQVNQEIKDAVIWHAPSRKFLAKKFNEAEVKELDSQALEILIAGLTLSNPEFAKASKKSSNKNRIILKLADIAAASNNQGISQIGEYLNQNKIETDNYLRKILSQTYHEYSLIKKLFESRVSRDNKSIKPALEAKSNLIYLCGNEAVEQVENLWRRI